ncbi:hypothetical protein CLOM_g7624 [Closterium sp. NIES-68]|nr:hypothetical protein CLOM_g7624 [Closterium sp. NIES-68]GJP65829.1 hypothetical protein CLOP_g22742 [Closterium sp. NIES-67]
MATEFSQRAGPTEPYVVMGIEYCVPHETVLVLKENIFSLHGRAEIRDTEGQLFFMSENKYVNEDTYVNDGVFTLAKDGVQRQGSARVHAVELAP